MSIERAIFTSAQTSHGNGYHLACRSDGLREGDARELITWGPSHDSLLDPTLTGRSVNFFPLSSGSYCVGRTVTAGEEYSERGGLRVFTTCLVVSSADLARFANNPFAVVRAALAAGELDVPEKLPQSVGPLTLGGRAAQVDQTALHRLSRHVPRAEVLRLATAVFEHQQLVVSTSTDPELFVAGLFNTLPMDRRSELSFSTGLKFSTQRPFRLMILPPGADEELRRAVHGGIAIDQVDDLRACSNAGENSLLAVRA